MGQLERRGEQQRQAADEASQRAETLGAAIRALETEAGVLKALEEQRVPTASLLVAALLCVDPSTTSRSPPYRSPPHSSERSAFAATTSCCATRSSSSFPSPCRTTTRHERDWRRDAALGPWRRRTGTWACAWSGCSSAPAVRRTCPAWWPCCSHSSTCTCARTTRRPKQGCRSPLTG